MSKIKHSPSLVVTIFVILFVTGLSSGCARKNASLQRAEIDLANAQENPTLMRHAALLVNEAAVTFEEAEQEWKESHDRDEVEHLVYLTERKLDIAREEARHKTALELAKVNRDAALIAAGNLQEDRAAANARARMSELAAEHYRSMAMEDRELIKELQVLVATLEARETKRGLELTLSDDVLFEFDRAELKPGGILKLRPLVDFLTEHPGRLVTIEGHTDSVGDERYNRDLSQRRADAVRGLLIQNGIKSAQIVSRGLGEQYPIASNETESGRLQNRRVQIIISGTESTYR